MADLYFNTKTSATRRITKKDLDKLDADARKRWRLASESEIELHEKREAQNKILAEKNKERVAKKEKADKEKEKRLNKKAQPKEEKETAPAANDTGSEEKADS